MHRIDVLRMVVREKGDNLIVCNIGDPSRELFSIKDAPNHFYMLGSMGLASSIGLGIALAQRDKMVVSIDGDGAVLMNLGTLVTIADQGLENFLLIVIDNEAYGSTGGQRTCTARGADVASIARGAGAQIVRSVDSEDGLLSALRTMRWGILVVKVDSWAEAAPVIGLPPRFIADRFMDECQRPSQ
jgi:sulfopyruvate decarboxylase subunit beta